MSLSDVLAHWFPEDVRFAVRDPKQRYPLIGCEERSIARAIPKRQNEFSAGRNAARAALSQFDQEPCEIPASSRRAPVWPAGFCGSITHSKTLCIAVVARTAHILSIGIDAEPDVPLKPELRSAILHESELHVSAHEAIQIFSMKEALFKALFPLTGEMMGFHAAKRSGDSGLELTRNVGEFSAGTCFELSVIHEMDHVISLCIAESAVK